MNKLMPLFISTVLVVAAAGCQPAARTSTEAPDNANPAQETSQTKQAPTQSETQAAKNDAQSEVRRDQLNADIRAREQRTQAAGGAVSDDDVASKVRSKLEANIPAGQLAVEADDGVVSVKGTVPKQDQLQKIDRLAKEINGVKSVKVDVKVAPPKQ